MKNLWKAFVAWCNSDTLPHVVATTSDGLFFVRRGDRGRALTKNHCTRAGAVLEATNNGITVEDP